MLDLLYPCRVLLSMIKTKNVIKCNKYEKTYIKTLIIWLNNVTIYKEGGNGYVYKYKIKKFQII